MDGFIDNFFVGDYSDFIDDVFRKHKIKEGLVGDGINELLSHVRFKNTKQYSPIIALHKKNINYPEKHVSDFSDKDMEKFPLIHGRDGLKGLSDFYDPDAIEIDIAMYKALANNKSYNILFNAFISLTSEEVDKDEADPLLEHFERAYQLFLSKTNNENIKKLKEYDKKHMIHYPIIEFLDGYFSLLYDMCKRTGNWEYRLQATDVIDEMLNRFTLSKRYKAYFNRQSERFQRLNEYPF